MKRNILLSALLLLGMLVLGSCCSDKDTRIEDDKLGFIDADVKSEDTNLAVKPRYGDDLPGESKMIQRSFEHAPPLIPHTTEGFFPIQKKRNVCLSCHMPQKAKKVNARPLPDSHFTSVRSRPVLKDGVYQTPKEVAAKKSKKFNSSYFNCSQCHIPQAEISVDIKNLFTPELSEKIKKNKLEQKK